MSIRRLSKSLDDGRTPDYSSVPVSYKDQFHLPGMLVYHICLDFPCQQNLSFTELVDEKGDMSQQALAVSNMSSSLRSHPIHLRHRHCITPTFESNTNAKLENRPIFLLANRMPIKACLASAPCLLIQVRLTHSSFLNGVEIKRRPLCSGPNRSIVNLNFTNAFKVTNGN